MQLEFAASNNKKGLTLFAGATQTIWIRGKKGLPAGI
jgi:hypothetical protein